ncbi:hypothetical protein OS493_032751, partial [Desmophyllum pertusum]
MIQLRALRDLSLKQQLMTKSLQMMIQANSLLKTILLYFDLLQHWKLILIDGELLKTELDTATDDEITADDDTSKDPSEDNAAISGHGWAGSRDVTKLMIFIVMSSYPE